MSLRQPVMRMASYLPPLLTSSESLQRIAKVADWFPAEISNTFCFECELTGNSSFADFAFSCTRDSAGVKILGRNVDGIDSTVWKNIGNLCRSVCEEDGSNINHLWFEFDIGNERSIPIPCVFLAIRDHCTSNMELLIRIFEALNYPSSPQFLKLLARCFRSPAFRNKSFEVGFMFSRQTDKARLVFFDIATDAVHSLEELGLTGAGELKNLLANLREIVKTINLAIDIGHTIASKIGLECQLGGKVQSDQPGWKRLLDTLISMGCSTTEKRDAILSWPGSSVERFNHLLWPTPVVRKISHVKVVWQPANLQAKAYLLTRYNPETCVL